MSSDTSVPPPLLRHQVVPNLNDVLHLLIRQLLEHVLIISTGVVSVDHEIVAVESFARIEHARIVLQHRHLHWTRRIELLADKAIHFQMFALRLVYRQQVLRRVVLHDVAERFLRPGLSLPTDEPLPLESYLSGFLLDILHVYPRVHKC